MSQDDSSYKQSSFLDNEDEAGQETLKRCSKCHETKPVSGFSKNRAQRDGYQNQCKVCEKGNREINSDKRRAHGAAYRAANPNKMREWREANADYVRKYSKAYQAANVDKIRVRRKAYNAANKEAIAARRVIYYKTNKEKLLAYLATWRDANRDALRAYGSAYRRSHRDVHRAAKHRRRARIKSNGGEGITSKQLSAMRQVHTGICPYCGLHYGPENLTIDHVIPITQDGPHEAANIVLACFDCNLDKGARTPEQWTRRWYYRLPSVLFEVLVRRFQPFYKAISS